MKKEGIKGIQKGKETLKYPYLWMIWSYTLKPQKTTQNFLDTIKSYTKVSGYKINIEKSLTFLYTNNEQNEKEYMKTIPFTIASKKSNT
jgi:hypothetical protein